MASVQKEEGEEIKTKPRLVVCPFVRSVVIFTPDLSILFPGGFVDLDRSRSFTVRATSLPINDIGVERTVQESGIATQRAALRQEISAYPEFEVPVFGFLPIDPDERLNRVR